MEKITNEDWLRKQLDDHKKILRYWTQHCRSLASSLNKKDKLMEKMRVKRICRNCNNYDDPYGCSKLKSMVMPHKLYCRGKHWVSGISGRGVKVRSLSFCKWARDDKFIDPNYTQYIPECGIKVQVKMGHKRPEFCACGNKVKIGG